MMLFPFMVLVADVSRRRVCCRVMRGRGIAGWPAALALIAMAMSTPAAADKEARWYKCTAFGGSHTGRYTFRVTLDPCAVYWLEIDRHLKIMSCQLPRIAAFKPFADSRHYALYFNLDNDVFSDHTAGWADRGRCVRSSAPDSASKVE